MKIRTTFALAGTLFALTAAPAAAQILGSGLGGGIGGSLGGTVNGMLGSPGATLGPATRGTLGGSADARTANRADLRSGRAQADAGATGDLVGAIGVPAASGGADGRASGNARVGVQAVGTDTIGGLVAGAAQSAAGLTGQAAGTISDLGTLGASGQGRAQGAVGAVPLVAAGSAAANDAGAFEVAPGMVVRDASGRAIGHVLDARATANGAVDTLFIEVDNRIAALPANSFAVSGDALVSGMSRAELRREARRQND